MTKETLTFEEALQRLEEVLAKLERSDCPLEEALGLFEEGMRLVQKCRGKLADVEGKVSVLLKDSQEFAPFSGEEEQA
ncbi:exodeoxyribonuclease VII small subunit [Dethiobacter alkaliphilus]|uniref:exodeoxyribonuclease VII small subunit n=1 Tax=Dethiobacter alkaliphilus TaxID=427926 RepID=UPI00222806AB|nr:exodeoxyribonuclease VII small subunit [Dethiobacter alkaliphilus]MCW3490263.1 exodeoxyribonuclease VII small subunit [Dethiobacter alkaliphilus]